MQLRTIGSLALMVTLAGCGAHTATVTTAKTGGMQARSEARFFPAQQNSVWQYEVSATPSDDPYVDPITGTETVTVDTIRRNGDTTTLQLRAIDTFTNEYRFPAIEEGPEGVTLKNVTYYGTAADSVEGHAIEFLKFPMTPGLRWDDGLWTGKAIAKETVKVPAGTFEAWKIDVIGTYDQAYTAVGKYWVAPGKGIVKSELGIPGWDIKSVMIPAGRKPIVPSKRIKL